MATNWTKVYDLSEDRETIDLIQKASRGTTDFGYVPEIAIFGSADWWAAVEDGRIERHMIEGVISRLYMTGHGDWPEVEVQSGDRVTSWTRLGDDSAYKPGKLIRIQYVVQRLKKPTPPRPVKRILTIWIGSN